MIASWVIIDKATRKAVLETTERRTAELMPRDRYDVVAVQTYSSNAIVWREVRSTDTIAYHGDIILGA